MEFVNVLIIIGLIVCIFIIIYNEMLKKRNQVKTAFSSLDVILKKRYDLMPNIVLIVKGYMEHESTVLTRLTELRAKAQKAKNIDESIELNNQIDNEMKKINVSIEGNPELKASQNFLQMQAVLNDIEEQISAARRTYNAHVEVYNTFISIIPINLFARMFKFKQYNQFEKKEEERENKIWM